MTRLYSKNWRTGYIVIFLPCIQVRISDTFVSKYHWLYVVLLFLPCRTQGQWMSAYIGVVSRSHSIKNIWTEDNAVSKVKVFFYKWVYTFRWGSSFTFWEQNFDVRIGFYAVWGNTDDLWWGTRTWNDIIVKFI